VKVLLGIPCNGTIKARTVLSVLAAMRRPEVTTVMLEGALGPENRNALAQEAISDGYTHLWLVDADMRFPDDAWLKLIARDVDVVGLAYHRRGLPLQTTVRIQDASGTIGIPNGDLPTELFIAYATGSGCQMITTSALQRMPRPWFSIGYTEEGLFMDDAIWFATQARSVGIDCWCDPTIHATHIGDYEY
jgi:hypothetical protein